MSMLLCDGLEKRICKRLTGQWNVVRIVGPVLPPLVLPPGQNPDSPMRDPLRTSPVWCTSSVMRVSIRIGGGGSPATRSR
jgi:hypothetical protein